MPRPRLHLTPLLGIQLVAMASPPSTPAETATVRVFLDIQNASVDKEFIRKQLAWVDWVRDREGANVHLLIVSLPSGSGGQRFTLRFLGLQAFHGMEDELPCDARPDATSDDIRQALSSRIALGLVRYAARTAAADLVEVAAKGNDKAAKNTRPDQDPWNAWVYKVGGSTFLNGESAMSSTSISGNLSASRVTEEQILRFSAGGDWNRNRYTLSDGDYRTSTQSTYASATGAWSLGDRWTWGILGGFNRSRISNLERSESLAPAIEYNVWKYSEATQKQLTFLYQLGMLRNRYFEQTIFGKRQETRFNSSLTASLDLNQPWGSVSASVSHTAFMGDWSKNNFNVFGSVSVRLVKGLSLNVFGSYSQVRDQIALAREGASDDEVLLKLRELKTSHRFFTSVGLSYTFGSMFNNAVNSRFRSAGGRTYMISM